MKWDFNCDSNHLGSYPCYSSLSLSLFFCGFLFCCDFLFLLYVLPISCPSPKPGNKKKVWLKQIQKEHLQVLLRWLGWNLKRPSGELFTILILIVNWISYPTTFTFG